MQPLMKIRRGGLSDDLTKTKTNLSFLIPAFLFMAVFLYYPFLQNIINSFMKIRNLGGSARGLNDPIYKNYLKILTDENVRMALKIQ